jgi:hypothetical protein
MEQVLDWLNENERRAYPLLEETSRTIVIDNSSVLLPDNFLLDLQLVSLASLVDVSGEAIPVYLSSLKLINTNLHVAFSSGEAVIATFIINSASTQTTPLYIRHSDGNLAVFGDGIKDFLNLVNKASFEVFINIYVEPSTVAQFNEAWLGVNKLTVSPEKISKNAMEVGDEHSYEPELPLQPMTPRTELQGDIKFLEGYNFRVNASSGLIDLEVGKNFGLKMSCATSFLPPEYLDCSELVSYINGVPPDVNGNFRLNAGTNIDITSGNTLSLFKDPLTEDANTYTLFVGLSFSSTDLCAPVNIVPSLA